MLFVQQKVYERFNTEFKTLIFSQTFSCKLNFHNYFDFQRKLLILNEVRTHILCIQIIGIYSIQQFKGKCTELSGLLLRISNFYCYEIDSVDYIKLFSLCLSPTLEARRISDLGIYIVSESSQASCALFNNPRSQKTLIQSSSQLL